MKTTCIWLVGIIAVIAISSAADNKGAEKMVLPGGKRGNVPFPHAIHQTVLGDCTICHSLFPQNPGAIEAYRKQGKLKKRQVMKHCQACHRKKAKAGEKAGPTRCKTCHTR